MTHHFKTPDWVKDAIFYQIFPDRFAKSHHVPKPERLEAWDALPTAHGYKGGDLWGVLEKLDYLTELGVNALYFNPIFQSASNHRYHTHDYYKVDPLLGGNEAFRQLLDRAHTRGIRIVLDGVFNHASRGFFQFNDIAESGTASPYLDWFIVYDIPLQPYNEQETVQYAAWWGLHALPKFNTDTPAVRNFLWDVAEYWIQYGIDGWRLDVPNEIDDPRFWQEFRRRVKAANPDAYICGEIWGDARQWLRGDQFDSVMNYLFTKAAIGFFVGESIDHSLIQGVGYHPIPPLNGEVMARTIESLLELYPDEITTVQLNLLGSHDTARFLSVARGDTSALKMATLFQMTYPGAPCIYYGDEIGMMGGKDPGSRGAFPWHDRSAWDTELLDYVKQAVQLRRGHPVLRRGSFHTLHGSGPCYSYARSSEQETLVVAFNVSHHIQHVTLELPSGQLQPRFGEGQSYYTVQDGHVTVELAPRTGAVWLLEPYTS